jgi:hypothetical protein
MEVWGPIVLCKTAVCLVCTWATDSRLLQRVVQLGAIGPIDLRPPLLVSLIWNDYFTFVIHKEKRSQRISHTRQAITENRTHKRRDNRESQTQEKRTQRISHTGKRSERIAHTKEEIGENLTQERRDHRESHTQEKRSQRIRHTREEFTENFTQKARYKFSVTSSLVCVILCYLFSCVCDSLWSLPCLCDSLLSLLFGVRFSVISCLVCEILCYLLPFVWNPQWTPLLCVWFSVTSCIVCVILWYILPSVWDSQWTPLLCVWFSVISSLACEILCDRESHTQGKR